MKHLYRLLLLLCSLTALPTTAQNWRPFRPNGDVHAFRGASADTVLTLRLDSTVRIGGDSVYYFNRIMQRANSFAWQKARNNQFGKLMGYNVAQRTYTLYWQGDPTPLSQDRSLVLKPFAAVGSSWGSAFADYSVTTTLVSRGTSLIDGVTDSVATFQTRVGAIIVLSKNFGLVSAPKDLLFGVPITAPTFKQLTLARRPAPAGLSYYNPLTLLDLQPGDELGYDRIAGVYSGPAPCYIGYILRRVMSRQVTADSVVYRLQQQDRTMNFNMLNCPGGGLVVSPVTVVRLAASRRTGEWGGSTQLLPVGSQLLAYAYQTNSRGGNAITIAYPVVPAQPGAGCNGPAVLKQEALYRQAGSATDFRPGLDALAWQQTVAVGVGVTSQYETHLIYSQRTLNGTVQTCGDRTTFATLLPTRAARAAATFQLYPNPASNSATLTLAGPARAATTVRLLDALGRTAGTWQLAAGQSGMLLPLQPLAAGVYVVQVRAANELPQYLRLQLER